MKTKLLLHFVLISLVNAAENYQRIGVSNGSISLIELPSSSAFRTPAMCATACQRYSTCQAFKFDANADPSCQLSAMSDNVTALPGGEQIWMDTLGYTKRQAFFMGIMTTTPVVESIFQNETVDFALPEPVASPDIVEKPYTFWRQGLLSVSATGQVCRVFKHAPLGSTSWTDLPPTLDGHKFGFVLVLDDGRLFVTGGTRVEGGSAHEKTEFFVNDQWIMGPDMPVAIMRHAAVQISRNQVLLIGGASVSKETWHLDLDTQIWTRKQDMQLGRRSLACALVVGGLKVVCVGGYGATTSQQDTVEVYDIGTNTWTPEVNVPPFTSFLLMEPAQTIGSFTYFGAKGTTMVIYKPNMADPQKWSNLTMNFGHKAILEVVKLEKASP